MMRRLISLAQWMPPSVRFWMSRSPFGPFLRHLLNRMHQDLLVVVELTDPLLGHRMQLDWQTHKGYVFGTYESEVCNLLQKLVRSGWVVADVGAHIGYYTLLLARLVGPSGRVYAFEPFPSNFRVLEENIALNSYRNIVAEPQAAGRTPDTLYLRLPHNESGNVDSRVLPSQAALTRESTDIAVEVIALDDYFATRGEYLDLIKIDVEGAENEVLAGMERILGEDRPLLLVELHGFDRQGEAHPVWQRLIQAGYRLSRVGKLGTQSHILAEPLEGKS
jgi:FkbM family methyltransferase